MQIKTSFQINELYEGINNYPDLYLYEDNNVQPPVLYGPSTGDPIGGIPAGDGKIISILSAGGYLLYKIIKRKKIQK